MLHSEFVALKPRNLPPRIQGPERLEGYIILLIIPTPVAETLCKEHPNYLNFDSQSPNPQTSSPLSP